MGVPWGTPKWMVYKLKWMIWGYPHFRKPPYMDTYYYHVYPCLTLDNISITLYMPM